MTNELNSAQKVVQSNSFRTFFVLVILSIIGLIIFNTFRDLNKPIIIKSFSPKNSSTTSLVKGDFIAIEFSKPISDKMQKDLLLTLTPNTDFDKIWKTPTTLILTNEYKTNTLVSDQEYKVTVTYANKNLTSWSFKTVPYENLGNEQKFQKFVEGQASLQKDAQERLTKRPWLENLPIKEKSYVVLWDNSIESIVIQLYIRTGSYNTEAKIETIKGEIINRLNNLGIDTSKEKIIVDKLQI